MEHAAVLHEGTKKYCFATAPGKFCIRLEAKKGDMASVTLHLMDKYLIRHGLSNVSQMPMQLLCSDTYKDYYQAELELDMICLRYFFELTDKEGNHCYFSDYLFYDEKTDDIEKMFDCPQKLREEESLQLPEWAKNKIVYQIFPARFATHRDVPEEVWYQAPIKTETELGGNLRGIINHLDYLKDLGADIVYMTPVFKSQSTHKYDIDDYYSIDPSFGTKEDLKELVEKAHAMGMYVMFDGVFNHSSIDFFAFKDIREKGAASRYLDWYHIKDLPVKATWGSLPNYLTFGYYYRMPKFNTMNPEVQDYIIDVVKYWTRECDIDGWRMDVGDEISHSFWKRFRREIKAVKPEILIVGEIWHYAPDFMEGDEWDTTMNYPFMNAVHGLAARGELTPEEYVERISFLKGKMYPGQLQILWNLIGSHDTIRFNTACGGDLGRHKLGVALQMLTPGMPMIYYGDEVGMEGGPDPDCRRGMWWDEKKGNQELKAFYKEMIELRKKNPAITQGRTTLRIGDNREGTITEERILGNKRVRIIWHCKPEEFRVEVSEEMPTCS